MTLLRILSLITLLLSAQLCGAADPAPRPSLSGTVTDQSGTPVCGATVYIWTAGVKTGYSTFCPSCYADCGKRAITDSSGAFTIPFLDPDLRFQVLTVKDGHTPTFTNKVDPVNGKPLEIQLPVRPGPADSRHAVRGTIVDPAGKPIAGAFAQINMVYFSTPTGERTGRGGRVDGLDPIAITNDKGEFTLVYDKSPILGCDIEVGARGFANRKLAGFDADQFPIQITLYDGGMIRGRLTNDGKPVANAQLILTCQDREFTRWLGEWTIGTNAEGEFLFSNIPPYEDGPSLWWLAPSMNSVKQLGAAAPVEVRVEKHGQDVVVSDIQIKTGYKATGRIIMPDDGPIPEGSRLTLSSTTSWDHQGVTLDSTGRFEFTGLWNGDYELHPSVKGYQVKGRQFATWAPPDIRIDNADATVNLTLEPATARPERPLPPPAQTTPSAPAATSK
ncbi:MAG: carboxypeptidase-like regulatory domain-containing protein [Phycisphaerales bacterium]